MASDKWQVGVGFVESDIRTGSPPLKGKLFAGMTVKGAGMTEKDNG